MQENCTTSARNALLARILQGTRSKILPRNLRKMHHLTRFCKLLARSFQEKNFFSTREVSSDVLTIAGDFYKDYVFLSELLERQIVTNTKTSLGAEVAPIVEEALRYLDTRADFWQRQVSTSMQHTTSALFSSARPHHQFFLGKLVKISFKKET